MEVVLLQSPKTEWRKGVFMIDYRGRPVQELTYFPKGMGCTIAAARVCN